MLKKKKQRYIIIYNIICFFLYLVYGINYIFAQEQELIFEIKPVYEFVNKAGRDPFEPVIQKQQMPVLVDIDISTFRLLGITESQNGKTALFMCRSGSSFGFVFVDGVLYADNNKKILGITGEIKSKEEVLLKQGDKEILFKLTLDVEGPNIKPEATTSGTQ